MTGAVYRISLLLSCICSGPPGKSTLAHHTLASKHPDSSIQSVSIAAEQGQRCEYSRPRFLGNGSAYPVPRPFFLLKASQSRHGPGPMSLEGLPRPGSARVQGSPGNVTPAFSHPTLPLPPCIPGHGEDTKVANEAKIHWSRLGCDVRLNDLVTQASNLWRATGNQQEAAGRSKQEAADRSK